MQARRRDLFILNSNNRRMITFHKGLIWRTQGPDWGDWEARGDSPISIFKYLIDILWRWGFEYSICIIYNFYINFYIHLYNFYIIK